MNVKMIAILAVIVGAPFSITRAAEVPDALTVEWDGQHPCEKLFEDAQVRVARCTFPPCAVHLCHSHPSYIGYAVSGGQGEVQDDKGIRKVNIVAGATTNGPPTPWHEFANVGPSTIQFIVIEKKYQAAPVVDQSVCPTRNNR